MLNDRPNTPQPPVFVTVMVLVMAACTLLGLMPGGREAAGNMLPYYALAGLFVIYSWIKYFLDKKKQK